jgi:hemoglobin
MRWMLLLVIAACSSHAHKPDSGAAHASCTEVGYTLRGEVAGVDASRFKQRAITRTCRTERWSVAAIDCIAREHQIYVCRALLADAQHEAYRRELCSYQKRFPDEDPVVESCAAIAIGKQTGSLYDRLGGREAIEAIASEWLSVAARDPRINAMFANSSTAGLRRQLVDQICQATGGPCTYTGKDMQTAHAGMGVTDAQFDAFLEDLGKALDTRKIDAGAKGELVASFSGLRGDIVQPTP